MRPEAIAMFSIEMDATASGRSNAMLRKTMIVLATAAILTAGLTVDAFARGGGGGGHGGGGGGGHIGGGFGGGHIGGGFGGVRMGGGLGGMGGRHFAGAPSRFNHGGRLRFGSETGDYGLYDYGCGVGYPYYNPNYSNCYLPGY
jgi:hypothetical protein